MRTNMWSGSISFGLLNIGIHLHSAQKDKSVSFSMLDQKDLAPIKYRKVNSKSGKEVPYDRIVKGYEYERGEYVIMDKKDFKNANPEATQTMDIEDFVSVDEINPMFYEKPYYVTPQKNNEKGYALLRDVLKKTNTVAIGRIVLHNKQHLAMLMAQDNYIVLENLRFPHEIKTADEVEFLDEKKLNKKYNAKEFAMAQTLVKGMTAEWDPEKYQDSYYDDIMGIINKKVKQGDSYTIEKPEKSEKVAATNVVDLLPLLKKSLSSKAKKPRGKKSRKSSERKLHVVNERRAH
jgi:DNA end-binding protein Ku